MEYLDTDELKRLLTVAHSKNPNHHLALLIALRHGARVSEVVSLKGSDIHDGQINLRRLKKSNDTIHPVYKDSNPVYDETPLIKLARKAGNNRIFNFSRQRVDQFIKKYAKEAGLHPNKAHAHALKHSCAMILWDKTQSLGQIQNYLGHKAASSTMCYLAEVDKRKAKTAMSTMF